MSRILEYLGVGADDAIVRKECVLECVLQIYTTVFGQEMESQDVLYEIQTGSIREQSVLLKLNQFFEPKNVRLDHMTLFRIKMNNGTIQDVADLIEKLVDEEEKKMAFRPAFSIGDQSITMTNTPYSRGDDLRYAQTLEDGSDEDVALNHPMFKLFDEGSDRTDISVSAASSISRMLTEKLGNSSLKAYRSQFDVQTCALSPSTTFLETHLKSPEPTFAHVKSRNKFGKSKSLVESKRNKKLRRTYALPKKRSVSQRLRPAYVPNATRVERGENVSTISWGTDSIISVTTPSPRMDNFQPLASPKNPETGI